MLAPGPNRIGATLRFTATFRDSDEAVFDPDTLTVKIYNPSGMISTFTYPTDDEVGKTSTGVYYFDYAPTEAGRWYIRWTAVESTTTLVLEDDFIVQVSPFVDMPYESRGDYQ